MIDTGLKDKVVLVTGAGGGIGAQTARAFGAQQAKVVVHFLEKNREDWLDPARRREHAVVSRSEVEKVAAEIRDSGGKATVVGGDLSETSSIARLFEVAESSLGPVDILVNNAAHCETPDDIFSTDAGSVDRHFIVNVRGPVLLTAEYVKRFREKGKADGRVINVSTDAAQVFATQISYGASKAALEAYTRSVAYEVGPLGITVNTVAPGPVQTGYITPELEESLLPSIPLRRLGDTSDIADVIVFLASLQARWVTGQVIRVSGGHVM